MKADDQKQTPTVATDPITGSTTVPPAEHTHHHPKVDGDAVVAADVAEFWTDLKHWAVRNSRPIGIALAVVFAVGLYLFWSSQNQEGKSRLWADLEQTTSPDALKSFADANADNTAGKIARMELARNQFGPNGIALLNTRNAESRKTAIENLEKARASFLALAEEFAGDLALRAEALKTAAEAELALVGIPKADQPTEFRGTVKAAVALYEKLAATVGETTPVGEWAKKRASELTANESTVVSVAKTLNDLFTPLPISDIKPPTGLLNPSTLTPDGPPIAPQEPIKIPTPPVSKPTPPVSSPTPPVSKPTPPASSPTPPASKPSPLPGK